MQNIISIYKAALQQAQAGLETAVSRLSKDEKDRGDFKPSEVLALESVRGALASQAQCLHQIAEPKEYPELPPSIADVVDFMDGRPVNVDFGHQPLAGGISLYSADQMRDYVEADRAKQAAPAPLVTPRDTATPATAPVVLPEPDAYLFQNGGTGQTSSGVYTEQKVRALLSQASAAPAAVAGPSEDAVKKVGNFLARKHAVYLTHETVREMLKDAAAPAAQGDEA